MERVGQEVKGSNDFNANQLLLLTKFNNKNNKRRPGHNLGFLFVKQMVIVGQCMATKNKRPEKSNGRKNNKTH